jgi:hypothetical protein
MLVKPICAPRLAPLMLKAEGALQTGGGAAEVADHDDALPALAADADAALDDGADGDALGIEKNFSRDGIGRSLSFFENIGGVR